MATTVTGQTEVQRKGKQAFDAMPGRLGVLGESIRDIVRGVRAGRAMDPAILREDAESLRLMATLLDKAASEMDVSTVALTFEVMTPLPPHGGTP